MLYDRPYMRAPTFGPRAGALKILLISLIVAFVCQSLLEGFVNGGAEFLGKWAMFSGESLLEGKIWTLVTYALLHDGPMHLLFNVLVIFFIGRALEEELGPRALAWLTVFGAVGGASAWCAFNLGAGSLIGASAVATAFLTCFCLRRPEQPITLLLFFVLPCTVKPKWVMWGVLAIELYGFLFMELKGSGGVAHSAHLGGMAVGLAYFARLRSATAGKAAKPRLARPAWLKSKTARKPVSPAGYTVNLSDRETVQKEVDRILDKINDRGFGALTDEEKRILDKAKTLLGK